MSHSIEAEILKAGTFTGNDLVTVTYTVDPAVAERESACSTPRCTV